MRGKTGIAVLYKKTKEALALYDFQPTDASRDLVQMAWWLEAPTEARGQMKNPTVENIRAEIRSQE